MQKIECSSSKGIHSKELIGFLTPSFQEIIHFLPGGVYVKNKEGIYSYCNQSFVKMLELNSVQDIIGKSDVDLWPEQAPVLKTHDQHVMEDGNSIQTEEEITLPNKKTIFFVVSKAPVRDENNCIIGVIGTSLDITEIKKIQNQSQVAKEKAEQENKTSINYLKNIIASVPGSIYWKNKDGVWLGCNDFTLKTTKINALEDIIGKTDYQLWPEQADALRENDKKVMASGCTLSIEEEVTLPNGEKRVFSAVKMPLRDENNNANIIGIVGNSLDITELKKTQESLRIAKEAAEAGNRAKDAFILNMAHDIRTPLTGMIHMSEDLLNLVNTEEALQYARLLEHASKQLYELLEGVLELSKAERINEDELNKETVNLWTIAQNLSDLLLPSIQVKGLAFKVVLDPELPQYVESDRIKLERILLNLITNAIKFTEKGQIELKIQCLSKQNNKVQIELCVSDTGIGMREDQLEKIFDRFVKVHPSYQGIYKGYGVGLFIVKQYVERLNGTIDVKSILGQGTCFIIRLELAIATKETTRSTETLLKATPLDHLMVHTIQPKETAFIHADPSRVGGDDNEQRILLVEDDPAARLGAQSRLKRAGYAITSAENVADALKLLKEQCFDLMLTDIGLPDGDGVELTKQYRAWEKQHRTNRMPIIALTGHGGEEAKEKFLASGIDDVFKKPLEVKDINTLQARFKQAPANDLKADPYFDEGKAHAVFSDEKELNDAIQLSLRCWAEELAILKKAHTQHDWEAITFHAHKLKGGSAYMGTTRLYKTCVALGEAIAANSKHTRELLFGELVQVLGETEKALQTWLQHTA